MYEFFIIISELMQQDGMGKKMENLVCDNNFVWKSFLPNFTVQDQKILMLSEDHNETHKL